MQLLGFKILCQLWDLKSCVKNNLQGLALTNQCLFYTLFYLTVDFLEVFSKFKSIHIHRKEEEKILYV